MKKNYVLNKNGINIPFHYPLILTAIIRSAMEIRDSLNSYGDGGGYMCIYSNTEKSLISFPVGDIEEEKMEDYLKYATEKVTRIVKEKSNRSFDSRNELLEMYGGGVRLRDFSVSFSGFSELIDEAISVVYGIYISLQNNSSLIRDAFWRELKKQIKSWQENIGKDNPFVVPLAESLC